MLELLKRLKKHDKIALRYVLAYVDKHHEQLRRGTTCVHRLKCLREVHKGLSPRTRRAVRDFNHLHAILCGVLQIPNLILAPLNVGTVLKSSMQRLFAGGSEVMNPAFLEVLRYRRGHRPEQSSESERFDLESSAQPGVENSKAVRGTLPGDEPPATRTPEVEGDAHMCAEVESQWSTPAEIIAERLLIEMDDLRTELEENFEEVNKLTVELSSTISKAQTGQRSAQLTIRPPPELAVVYVHAFGSEHWKACAIELQSTRALPACELLPCIVWSFLTLEILEEPTSQVSPFDRLASNTFLKRPIEFAGANYDQVLRDAVARHAQDSITNSKWTALARRLMLVLEAHLQQSLGDHVKHKVTRLANDICKAALFLRASLVTAREAYQIEWYSVGKGDAFDEDAMERLQGIGNGNVAFTSMPGLSRRPPGRGVIRNAAVKIYTTI